MLQNVDQEKRQTNNNRRKHSLRFWLIGSLLVLFVGLGVICLCYWFFLGRFYVNTDDAYVHGNQIIISPQALASSRLGNLLKNVLIVDLRLFGQRNFAVACTIIFFGYMSYFAPIVVLPLWLQNEQGYTPTWAGFATARTNRRNRVGPNRFS